MDRYIVREPRLNTDHYEGNAPRMISMTSRRLHIIDPDEPYYPGKETSDEFLGAYMSPMNVSVFSNQMHPGHMQPPSTRNISGIDPNYLAAYSSNFSNVPNSHIPSPREVSEFQRNPSFGVEYQNRNFHGPERNLSKPFAPQNTGRVAGQSPKATTSFGQDNYNSTKQVVIPKPLEPKIRGQSPKATTSFGQDNYNSTKQLVIPKPPEPKIQATQPAPRKIESAFHKVETTTEIMSRSEKLKMLHKTGPRAFTGPVEKVLKWHKSLHDLGTLVIYEVIGKCVSVRPGESCAKNLVVRDDNGPAMQVVYYEIDFLLPEFKPPCMVRVIGRMLSGTSRLHAFSARAATGDDVAVLPRRAAVAAHHVFKLCKEYCNTYNN